MKNRKTTSLVEVALFTAIVFALSFIPFIGYIPLGFTKATTVHIPVIIASVILGPKKGGIIGFMFGLTSLIMNTFQPTLTSFVFSPFYASEFGAGGLLSLVICFVPRILVGVVPYYVYKLLKNFNSTLSLTLAGISGSLTNTILVMSMIYLFFGENYALARECSFDALIPLIMGVVTVNGIPEAIVAGIISTAVCKSVLKYRKHSIG